MTIEADRAGETGSTIGDDRTTTALSRKNGIASLRLFDFRNYAALNLNFDKHFVVFAGANGAGKTNLLEAISLLSPGRGLRRASYGDMARKNGAGAFSIRADIKKDGDVLRVLTGVRSEPGSAAARTVKIDQTQARSADELLDLLRIVWLTPAMDGLFTGPAIAAAFSIEWSWRSIPFTAAGRWISNAPCVRATSSCPRTGSTTDG